MTNKLTIELPKLGESIVEATVVQWFKKEGDWVELDEPLLEVATDKINSEIPSPAKGRVEKILALPDQLVKVGEKLAILSTNAPTQEVQEKTSQVKESSVVSEKRNHFYSPAVIRLAQENQIPLEELDKIPRKGERLTKKDVEHYLDHHLEKKKEPDTEKVKMTPLRKAIADNMVRSFYQAPHASLMTEIDVTEVLEKIHENKESFLQKHQAKLSITTVFAKALCMALKEYSHLNASLEEDTIVVKNFVNLGIAVSVEGGVVVPVIQSCNTLPIFEIAQKISGFAQKAKNGKLS